MRKLFLQCLGVFLLLSMFTMSLQAQVSVYPGIETQKSAKYKVVIKQGASTYESFVYQDASQVPSFSWMTDFNHWTTFSFSGAITIEVTDLTAPVTKCDVFPKRLGINPVIAGNKVTFSLSEPAKLNVQITDGQGRERDFTYNYNNPLFIFADAPEVNAPSPTDADVRVVEPGQAVPEVFTEKVLYFKPGVHNIGPRFKVQDNKVYYLAGGSFLYGSFRGANVLGNAQNRTNSGGVNNTTIRGRGILCGRNIPHMPYSSGHFDGTAVYWGFTGVNQKLEGITIIDPSQYCIQSYGGVLETDNVKCFGWWYETDGWVGGNGSTLKNSFFKVNDDVVKVYFEDQIIEDLTIYHQQNGACFQLGWGSDHTAKRTTVQNIDVIQDDAYDPSDNRSLINGSNVNGNVSDLTFRDIRADQDIYSIIIIKHGTGLLGNIKVQNVTINKPQHFGNKLQGGTINGITFENLKINGSFITSDAQLNLTKTGNVTNIRYLTGDVATFTITASAGANGSISPTGAVTVSEGDTKTFTITPVAGYTVADVVVDGVSQGPLNSYTFTNVTANHTIRATFAQAATFTITASASANGTITPSGAVAVVQGASQTFTFTPVAGYQIQSVVVDGVSQGVVASYTFANVQGNHTIRANFSLITTEVIAYQTHQAEANTGTSGGLQNSSYCVPHVGQINGGEWILFSNLDFGSVGLGSFDVRATSGDAAGGSLEIRLGSPTGTLVGSVAIPNTGGWCNYTTFSKTTSAITGLKNVYVVFVGGADIYDLDWIKFNERVSTNPAPVVALTAPANNTQITQGAALAVSATASDANGSIAKVELFVDAALTGTDLTAPYTWTVPGLTVGSHTIYVVATDNEGASTQSESVTVTVTPGSGGTNPNLLSNAGFENGVTGWTGYNNTAIQAASTPTWSGGGSVRINRTGQWKGVQQDITSVLQANGQGNYDLAAYIRTASGTLSAHAILRVVDGSGVKYFGVPAITANANAWTQSGGTLAITWTGTLQSAFFYVETSSTGTNAFFVDGCSLKKTISATRTLMAGRQGVSLSNMPLVVYPVPAQSVLHIEGTDSQAMVHVYDMLGKIVLTQKGIQPLNVSGLKSGVYTLRTATQQVRFVKE